MSQIKTIDAKTLKLWLDNNECLLIDVREVFEYNQAYIKHALNIPLSQLLIKIDDLNNQSVKKIVLSCKAGVRSKMAYEILEKNWGVHELWNLSEGLQGWISSGLPVLTKK